MILSVPNNLGPVCLRYMLSGLLGLFLALVLIMLWPTQSHQLLLHLVLSLSPTLILTCLLSFLSIGLYGYYLGIVRKNPDTLLLAVVTFLPWLNYLSELFLPTQLFSFQPLWIILGILLPGGYVSWSYQRQLRQRLAYLNGLMAFTALAVIVCVSNQSLDADSVSLLMTMLVSVVCVALAGASNKTQQESGRCMAQFTRAASFNLFAFSIVSLLNAPPSGLNELLPFWWLYTAGMSAYQNFGLDKRADNRFGLWMNLFSWIALALGAITIYIHLPISTSVSIGTGFLVLLGLNLTHHELLHRSTCIALVLLTLLVAGLISYQTLSGLSLSDLVLSPVGIITGHGFASLPEPVIQENSYLLLFFRFGLFGALPFVILLKLLWDTSRSLLTTPSCYSFRYLDSLTVALITSYLLLAGCSPIAVSSEPIFWILLTLAYIQSKRLRQQWI